MTIFNCLKYIISKLNFTNKSRIIPFDNLHYQNILEHACNDMIRVHKEYMYHINQTYDLSQKIKYNMNSDSPKNMTIVFRKNILNNVHQQNLQETIQLLNDMYNIIILNKLENDEYKNKKHRIKELISQKYQMYQKDDEY